MARAFGWEGTASGWPTVVRRSGTRIVDISTPNDNYAEIAGARVGKAVICGKPLGISVNYAVRGIAVSGTQGFAGHPSPTGR